MQQRRNLIGGVIVVGLGLGLYGAFHGLGNALPNLFPHLSRETRADLRPPVLVPEETPTPSTEQPPPAAAPSRSPEDALLASNEIFIQKGKHGVRISKQLVTPSPIPDLRRGARPISGSFEITSELEPIVDFWRKVYAVWDADHVVIHDMDNLDIQYAILDFSNLDRKDLTDSEKRQARDETVNQEISHIKEALTELENWNGIEPLSKEARPIAQLFDHIGNANKYKEAKEKIRTQTGLKDRFAEGLRRSGRYMALFEEVLQNYGIPKEISRLPFVESLFKERVMSKVGAVGLWQFMPDTARRYMVVDPLIDERYDPVMATHGAARLLQRNYDLLGSWPLAINAYNSGPANLLKAISKFGTQDLGTIVTNFKSGSYAFASRNFYPSFLAALDVYEHAEKYFGRISRDPPLRFDRVDLPATMGFNEIAYLADVALDDLKSLNPSFQSQVFEDDYALPAGTQIRIPTGRQPLFASRFVQYYAGLESPLFHVISPGESLHDVASQYGLAPQDLQRVNAVDKAETGRVLMIPSTTSLVKN